MKPKRWDTQRLALYGAIAGAVIGVLGEGGGWLIAGRYGAAVGVIVGSAVGLALLVAVVSGIRNMFVR